MNDITLKQFLFTQPEGDIERASDKIYLQLSNKLLYVWRETGLFPEVSDDLKKVVVIGITGYFQDLMCDTGVWRTFTDECLRLYGMRVPFHESYDSYIEYELNIEDIEFLIWYQLAFNSMQFRYLNPLDSRIDELADALYEILEEAYDTLPNPTDYKEFFDVELHNDDDSEQLYSLSRWLYWKNWLLMPPFQLTYAQIYPEIEAIRKAAKAGEDIDAKIEKLQSSVMSSVPTGPLALYLREWLSLIITGKVPKQKAKAYKNPEDSESELTEHPYYTAFRRATNGRTLAFIPTYEALNKFLINAMGWKPGEEHLPTLKGHKDFVLMVTPHSGLMVAKEIAKCVKHPDNQLYDGDHASKFAFNLLSRRGACPGDMLRYFLENGCLPDAKFPDDPTATSPIADEDSRRLVADNADFLARAYLQEYYRGD